jgi:hypothetical protein
MVIGLNGMETKYILKYLVDFIGSNKWGIFSIRDLFGINLH